MKHSLTEQIGKVLGRRYDLKVTFKDISFGKGGKGIPEWNYSMS